MARIDPATGAVQRTIDSNRFVTGVISGEGARGAAAEANKGVNGLETVRE